MTGMLSGRSVQAKPGRRVSASAEGPGGLSVLKLRRLARYGHVVAQDRGSKTGYGIDMGIRELLAAGPKPESVETWLAAQERASRAALARAVSPEGFRHVRPEFGQVVEAAPGAVAASLHRARWDPAPDYAYHWVRDAAVVMLLAPELARDDPAGWRRRMADHVAFSLRIATRPPATGGNPLRATTSADAARFLRPDSELAALSGDALLGEPRAGLDGGPDLERWSRPQYDGPALRALACLAWSGPTPAGLDDLVARDLDFTLRHAALPCVGPWEEEGERDLHAFTLLAQRAALGAGLAAGRFQNAEAAGEASARIDAALASLAEAPGGVIRARAGDPPGTSDAAVLLGVLLGDPIEPDFGLADARVLATADWLIDWSLEAFPVNGTGAPLVGRSPADRYFGGNPWLPTTFGLAEYVFRLAAMARQGLPAAGAEALRARLGDVRDGRDAARKLSALGDAFIAAVARHLPDAGPLPEQLDRATGAPCSCPDLTWSHAALEATAVARRDANPDADC